MRNEVFKTLFLLAFPLLALLFGVEFYILNYNGSVFQKNNILEKYKNSASTVIVGSSLGLYGIKTKLFSENTINLAGPSQSLLYDLEIVKKATRLMPKLDQVYWVIAPFSLHYILSESDFKYLVPAYSREFNVFEFNQLSFRYHPCLYSSQLP